MNKIASNKKRNERIGAFQNSLAGVYRQFQMLLDDYKELEEKYEATQISANTSLNVTKYDESKCCRCGAAQQTNETSKVDKSDASAAAAKQEKAKSDFDFVRKKDVAEGLLTPNCDQSFQIFSQDFCTQGLEESFLNHDVVPLQDIQNVTPTRSKSPVFGSKKGKATRPRSSPINSPNLSEKSVVILLDSPKTSSKSETLAISDTQDEMNVRSTPKTVKKWGISTIQHVSTDLIIGSKKKLKQSKIFLRTEKVTDLSSCDDLCDKDREARIEDLTKRNCTEIDNSCLEDSLIQVSPTQNNGSSRMRQKIVRRNKSAETLQMKINRNYAEIMKRADSAYQTDTETTIFEPNLASTQYGDPPSHSKALEAKKTSRNYAEIIKRAGPAGHADTETTIFEPNLASTRYGDSPSHCKAVKTKKMTIGGELGSAERRIDNSDIIDDTMFVENVTSSNSWSQKKQNFETSSLQTKSLSLKIPTKSNKGISLSSLDELKEQSPPRKKLARAYYDAPPKKRAASPTYAYKRSPVRKQAEKNLLNGWSCLDCQNYYEALNLPKEELQKRKNTCSRHRSKFNEQKCTQKDYWNPDFTSSFHSTIWGDD